MAKQGVFLIRADSGRECVMRLPVGKYGGITTKAYQIIRRRFYECATDTQHGLKYALNLEAFSNGRDLAEAISKYNNGVL